MGRGNKSSNNRKEVRKEGRTQKKDEIRESKSKQTGKAKSLGSNGGISKITMGSEDEEMLLKLITMLDSGELDINLASSLANAVDAESDSESDVDSDDSGGDDDDLSDDDEDEDDISDSDFDDDAEENDFNTGLKKNAVPTEQPVKSAIVFTDKQRRSLVRKLIRDDRKMSVELAHKVAQEKASRRSVSNAIMSLETDKSRDKNALPEPPTSDDSSGLPSQYLNLPPGMTSALRINVSCESKESKSGGIKLVMADRTNSLDALVQLVRNKFNASKKFSELVIMPAGKIMDPDDLISLPDGTHVVLSVRSIKETKIQQTLATHIDYLPVVNQGNTVDKKPSSVVVIAASSEEDQLVKEEFWSPPENSNVLEVIKTPRIVNDEAECSLLKKKQEDMLAHSSYKSILIQRQSLPIHKVRENLLDTIRDNQFVVVSGETGSGKTTQLPAYILEDLNARGKGAEGYIICTQPSKSGTTKILIHFFVNIYIYIYIYIYINIFKY
jgi:flagellar biosynthesis GTPase FlhF